jgi:hypothetical protein
MAIVCRANVHESEGQLVAVDLLARARSGDDPAEDAIVGVHR